jgi:hypothetical protein
MFPIPPLVFWTRCLSKYRDFIFVDRLPCVIVTRLRLARLSEFNFRQGK